MSVNTEVANSSLPLESLWGLATVAVIKAQLLYATLVSHGAADEVVAKAWLQLWRAEEWQRELDVQLDQPNAAHMSGEIRLHASNVMEAPL